MEPIIKFNGGVGATLCHTCSGIISLGHTTDLYCELCHPDNIKDKTSSEWLEEIIEKQGFISRGQWNKSKEMKK